MPILTKSDPSALASKLVKARQKYDSTRESVISSAVARRNVIDETVADLNDERDAVVAVEQQARNS